MKTLEQLHLPQDCRYSREHEWGRQVGQNIRIGITDYAQDQLGEVIYLELPTVGDSFRKDEVFGSVESVKAVSELFVPVGGEVTAVNSQLRDSPQLVNKGPYDQGWMIEIRPADMSEYESLLDRRAYLDLVAKGDDA
jgi:glycine cleavage system H protein